MADGGYLSLGGRLLSLSGVLIFLIPAEAARAAPRGDGDGPILVRPVEWNPPSVTDALASRPPPAGAEAFRPTHFSVTPIIVSIERARTVAQGRRSGLYGP